MSKPIKALITTTLLAAVSVVAFAAAWGVSAAPPSILKNTDDKEFAPPPPPPLPRPGHAYRPGFPFSAEELASDSVLKATDLRTRKIDAARLEKLRSKAASAPVRVIVLLKMLQTPEGLLSDPAVAAQHALIKRLQTSVLDALKGRHVDVLAQFDDIPVLALKVDVETLDLLAKLPEVADIGEDRPVPANLGDTVPLVGAADVMDRGFGGNDWVVAVLDTGIDLTHPFLTASVAQACFSDKSCPNGESSQTGAGAADYCRYAPGGCSHGSHTSGIAIGAAVSGVPGNPTLASGVARSARLMPIQVFSRVTGTGCTDAEQGEDPCTLTYTSDQTKGLKFVFDQRSRFRIGAASMSLGGGRYTGSCDTDPDNTALKMVIDNLRSAGIATVISTGNKSYTDAVSAPACISSAIPVGATTKADGIANYSNNFPDLRLVAPGSSVTSSVPTNAWGVKSGTSMAAPHVAGAFALLQSQQNRTVRDTYDLLVNTGKAVIDTRTGAGNHVVKRIDVLEAMSLNKVFLAEATPRTYRGPSPIEHKFSYIVARQGWSAVAVRPDASLNVDMQLLANSDYTGPLATSRTVQGSIDVIAQDNSAGRQRTGFYYPLAYYIGGAGRYAIEFSNPGVQLGGSLSDTMDDTHILRVYTTPVVAGRRQYISLVPIDEHPLDLYAFTSTSNPSTWTQSGATGTRGVTAYASNYPSFVELNPAESGSAGIVVTQKAGGNGRYTIYNDSTAPSGSVTINNGDAFTTSRTLNLQLAASDPETGVDYMQISIDGVCDTERAQAFASSETVTVPTTGLATVSVCYHNRAGAWSAAFTDTIQVLPTISVSDASLVEGNGGASAMNFQLSLSGASNNPVTVTYATANGSATAGSDYLAANGNVTFAPGETSKTITVTINGDASIESDETFFLNLTGSTGADIADNQGIGTIVNDDSTLPRLSVGDAGTLEGNSGTSTLTFQITLSVASGSTVTVAYATADDTATAGSDYVSASGTLTFAPGETSKTVNIALNGDTAAEFNEAFLFKLSNASGATIATSQAVGTIFNDDSGSLSINDISVIEGNSGSPARVFTVTLSAATSNTVMVAYATADGTATAGSDYVASSGTLTFIPGQTSQTLSVMINGDSVFEPDEAFFMNLSSASGATIADGQGVATIVNDDSPPQLPALSVTDVGVQEGNLLSTKLAAFEVRLSAAASSPVTVFFTTADSTANAGSDYVFTNGTLTFAPGEIVKIVNVTVNGDTALEPNETFLLLLSNASGATIADAQGIGSIFNDDSLSVYVADAQPLEEGNSGTTTMEFVVGLTASSPNTVTVAINVANGSATANSDFVTPAQNLVTFAPGEVSKPFFVTINGDTAVELDETFFVNISNPTGGAAIADGQAVGTIVDDDDPNKPAFSVGDAQIAEGNSGSTTIAVEIRMSNASPNPTTVFYATENGSAEGDPFLHFDYVSTSGRLDFAPGQISKTILVTVFGDTLVEPDETFGVVLSRPVMATIADGYGVVTIVNDDLLNLSVADAQTTEGDSGTKNLSFTVQLAAPANGPVTVNYATANGTATAGSDYVAKSGTLNFDAGVTSRTVVVKVNGDTATEPDETFFVNLSNPTGGATIADGQAVGTIVNDEGATSIGVNDVSVAEGAPGAKTPAKFTVTLSRPSTNAVTVDYTTADGSAAAPGDYTAARGTLSIAPGKTSATISLKLKGDATPEPNENFSVDLSNPVNATINDGQGIATIVNDD